MRKIYKLSKLICITLVIFSAKIFGQCISLNPYGSGTMISSAPGSSITLSTCNFGGEYASVTFSVTGSFTYSSSISTDYLTVTDGSNNVLAFGLNPLAVTIPSTGLYYMHVSASGPPGCTTQSVCRTTSVFVPLLPCAGTPTAGTVPASYSICPNTITTINANGATAATGIIYQWMQASSASGPWTNVTTGSGFNTTSLTTTSLTTLTYYQMVITCTSSAQSATTSVVSVNPNNPATVCYCNQNLGGSGCSGDNITNVSILNTLFNNNSTCTTTPTNGTYSQFPPSPSTTATLNIAVTYTISVNTTASNIESVWIDYDHSGTFDVSEHTQITTSSIANSATTMTITIPASALLGQTGMRVRSRGTGNQNGPPDACLQFGSGETEDYIVTIAAATPCAGTPAANSAVTSMTNVCPSGTVSLSLATSYTVGGLTYQWYSAPASAGPYTAIAGATTAIYAASNLTTTLFYHAVITCTNGPASTTSTPVQVNVSSNPCQCSAYCASNATYNLYDEIFNVNIGTLNNTSSCSQTGGPGSILNEYSNYAGIVAAPSLTAASSYSLSVTVGMCGVTFGNSGIVTAFMDFNNNGSFGDPGESVFTSSYTAFTVAGTTVGGMITIPATANPGITRMRIVEIESSTAQTACGTYFAGETEDYCINIAAAAPCAGAPASNSVIATATNVCPNGSTNLSLATSYTVGGLTYQWFTASAPAGPYTSVTGATLSTYSPTNITAGTYYQAVITCTNGPASTTATPIHVLVGGSPCQCAAYCASNATSTNDEEIFNVSIGTLNNTTACGQTGGPTSTVSLYSNYAGILASPNLAAGLNYTLSMTVGECNGNSYSGIVAAYFDFNQNGSFTDAGELVYSSTYAPFAVTGTTFTTVVTVPVNATLGTTRMRIVADESSAVQPPCGTFTWGETEDYCITITAPTPCAGTPGANSAVTSATSTCPNGTATLSLANSYTVGGLTYQWSTATTAAGPYTAVAGATLSTYTPTNITTSLYYHAVITCTNGPASTTSSPVQVVVSTNPCQCTAFCASNATSTFYDEILNVTIGTLNNNSNCSQTGGPGSMLNEYSNYAGMLAVPNITAGVTYSLSVTVGMCNATFANSGIVTAYMDFNNNGSFADPGETVYTSPYTSFAVGGTTVTANIPIPATTAPGIIRMRIVESESSTSQLSCGTYFAGETEDYCINIIGATPCTGVPASNSSVANPTFVCSGGSSTLTLANSYSVGGLTFQWSTATSAAGPYTAVSGATSTAYTATNITTPLYYHAVVTCTNSSSSTTATPIQITILGAPVYANVPFLENFDNTWQNRCDNHNVPVAANWDDSPTTGNQSWRRQDDGNSANWTASTTGIVTPLAGAGCADFHSYFAPNFSTGDLSLYVNLSANTYSLSFYHTNFSGDDSLEVFLSTNGGATFTKKAGFVSGDYSAIDQNWNKKTILLTSVNSSSCVIKFTGNSDFGNDDIGIDSLQIVSGCAAPSITLAASQSTICNGASTNLTATGATSYTWSTNANTASISVTPSVTTVYTVTGQNTPGCPGTKTISITVKPSPTITVTGNPSFTICPGGSAVLTASSTSNNYTWTPGSFTTAAITVSPSSSVVYNIASTNTLGCVTNSNVTVFVVICTGLSKNSIIDNNTFVYPNPNNGNINVVIEDYNGSYTFEVNDLSGRLVYKATLTKAENALNIKELANGMYTYKITSLTTKTAIKEGKLIKE